MRRPIAACWPNSMAKASMLLVDMKSLVHARPFCRLGELHEVAQTRDRGIRFKGGAT